jgi:hypothetical protein
MDAQSRVSLGAENQACGGDELDTASLWKTHELTSQKNTLLTRGLHLIIEFISEDGQHTFIEIGGDTTTRRSSRLSHPYYGAVWLPSQTKAPAISS